MIDNDDASSEEPAGPGDADLVLRTRSGDTAAFGELWRRHYRSGITVARNVSPGADADDLVQEAYTRIYQSILKGGGPTGSFRAYLFTSIRNTAAGWGRSRRETTIDELELLEDPATTEQATAEALDRGLTHQAFRSLPTRWQEVLWYSEIEAMKPSEIAPLLGMKATAVAQLTFRAREGLREAWIQAHLRSVADGSDCAWAIERLGAYARNNVGRRDRARVEGHLAGCSRCAIVASEAKDVSSRLALVLIPLTVGVAGTAGYLATLQGAGAPVAAFAAMPSSVVQGAVTVGSGSAGSAAGLGGSSLAGSGAGAGSAAGASSVVGAGSTVGSGIGAGAASVTTAAGTAAGAGSVAAATATTAVVATGGMLGGAGVAGLAAAGLVVVGTVAAAVALPGGPTSADVADERSPAVVAEGEPAPDTGTPLEMIAETSVPIAESETPTPADIPVLPVETTADPGSSGDPESPGTALPEQSPVTPDPATAPADDPSPADPGEDPDPAEAEETDRGEANGNPGNSGPGESNPGKPASGNPGPGKPASGSPGPEGPPPGTTGPSPGSPPSGKANSGPGKSTGGGKGTPEEAAALPESMPAGVGLVLSVADPSIADAPVVEVIGRSARATITVASTAAPVVASPAATAPTPAVGGTVAVTTPARRPGRTAVAPTPSVGSGPVAGQSTLPQPAAGAAAVGATADLP